MVTSKKLTILLFDDISILKPKSFKGSYNFLLYTRAIWAITIQDTF